VTYVGGVENVETGTGTGTCVVRVVVTVVTVVTVGPVPQPVHPLSSVSSNYPPLLDPVTTCFGFSSPRGLNP